MYGLASKVTTTWFLAGLNAAQFIKFHFEAVNTVQLAYTATGNTNSGLTWHINSAYII
jgi:hypothetical protein